MMSELLAVKAQPLLTAAIASIMGDYGYIAASIPKDPVVQAAELRQAGDDIVALAAALEVLVRRGAEETA